jgi:hypothetical protein
MYIFFYRESDLVLWKKTRLWTLTSAKIFVFRKSNFFEPIKTCIFIDTVEPNDHKATFLARIGSLFFLGETLYAHYAKEHLKKADLLYNMCLAKEL